MMPPVQLTFSGGNNTARDRSDIGPDEMVESTGGFYRPGDAVRIHKLGGRSVFDEVLASTEVKGLALCQFDSGGTDLLIGFAGTDFYKSTPGATGSFSAMSESLTGDGLSAAHANDLWFLCTGDDNRVLKNDGTTRTMGLYPPQEKPVLTAMVQGVATADDADSDTGNFVNPANAHDGDIDTFASATLTAPAATANEVYSWAAGSVGSDPVARISWSLGVEDSPGPGRREFNATVKFEKSTDGVPTYTETHEVIVTDAVSVASSSVLMTGLTDPVDANIRVTFTLNSADGVIVTLRIHKVYLGYSNTDDTPVDGTLLYAVSEEDQTTGLPPSSRSPVAEITLEASSDHIGTKIDLSTLVPRNTRSTHWVIWRTASGGTETQLTRAGDTPIADDVYYDTFNEVGVDEQYDEPYPMLQITQQGSTNYYHRDLPPPALRRVFPFQGALCGLTKNNVRALAYSVPGEYESWPTIYVFDKFPLKEHDELLDGVGVGTSLVIGAKAAMIRMDELPQVIAGTFVGRVSQIKGAPGCVGEYALTELSMAGEQAAAWISPYGIYVTNGHTFTRISDDVNWDDFKNKDMSNWVLEWDWELLALVFAYSSTDGGANDRYQLIHMDPNHRKKSGQPKWTGPHYGAINAWVSGQVSNVYRRYSAHPSDGNVYLENNSATGADASNTLDSSGTHRLRLKTGRMYDQWREWAILDARLRHTDFGSGQSCTVANLVGRDSSGHESTRSQTVSLAGQKAHQFDVSRGGDYHEVTLTHDSTGLGAIQDLVLQVQQQGRAGTAKGGP